LTGVDARHAGYEQRFIYGLPAAACQTDADVMRIEAVISYNGVKSE